MISPKQLLRIIPFTIILVTIFSILPYPSPRTDFIRIFDNTIFWWIIQVFILFVFLHSKKYFFDISNAENMTWVRLYLLWNLLSFSRGLFIAEGYWDWKALLGNTFSLLIPVVAFIATNKTIVQAILSNYIKYALPLFFAFAFLITYGSFGAYLVPISFLTLFFPFLPFRWKWIILGFAFLAMFAFLGARSNVIKFGVPVLLMSIYYFNRFITIKLLEIIRIILFSAPVVLFSLGVTDTFNVFNIEEYIEGEYEATAINPEGELVEENLSTDTRTFLYIEVLQTARKHNTWWIGRSPARGNETEWFEDSDITGRGERLGNEVAILNIFTWTGIIGVLIYFAVFFKASYLAVNQSRNIFAKILGIFMAFRWLYAWVEDINYFTLNTLMLWIMIGLCLSKSFREMTNDEIKVWVHGIFSQKKAPRIKHAG